VLVANSPNPLLPFFVYDQETKRDLKRIPIYMCWYNERLKAKDEGSIRLVHTVLCGGLEQLRIETRLRGGMFESVMGDCVI
jgi:hypothetical protein